MNPDVNEFNSLNDQNACSCQYYTIQEFLAAFQINANDKSANIPIISKNVNNSTITPDAQNKKNC